MRLFRGARSRRTLTYRERVMVPASIFSGCAAVVLATTWLLQMPSDSDLSTVRAQSAGGGVITLDWPMLRRISGADAASAFALDRLRHKAVRLQGYVLPLQTAQEGVREFVLTPFLPGGFEDAPAADQIVRVRLTSADTTRLQPYRAVLVSGQFQVERFEGFSGTGYYQIINATVP